MIGSGEATLCLSRVGRSTAVSHALKADLHIGGLVASVLVHEDESGTSGLADFFRQQAQDWRGWGGLREWESLEGDLRIEARYVHGHVQLRVTLHKALVDPGNNGWSATGDLTIEPGEQLARIAADVQALEAGESGTG